MEEKKYRREEGRNDVEKAVIPKGELEELLFSKEERESIYYQLNYGGIEYDK